MIPDTTETYSDSPFSYTSTAILSVVDSSGKVFKFKANDDSNGKAIVENKTDYVRSVKLYAGNANPLTFTIPITVESKKSGTGSLYLKVDPVSSQDQFPATMVELAKFEAAQATVSVVSGSKSFGDNGVQLSDPVIFQISEPVPGVFKANDQIKISLPDGFTWNGVSLENVLLGPSTFSVSGDGSKDITIKITDPSTSSTGRYLFTVKAGIKVDSQVARKGDVVVAIGGAKPATLTIGRYGDYQVNVSGEPNDIWAARKVETGQLVGKLVLDELLPKSLIDGRTIKVTLPDGAQWDDSIAWYESFNFPASNKANLQFERYEKIGDDVRVAVFTVTSHASSDAGKTVIEIKQVKTKPSFNGPLTVEVSGTAGASGTATIANVKPIITVTVENKRDVVIGARNQVIGDIVVKENVAGALKGGKDLTLSSEILGNINSFVFDDAGKIEVRSGDIEFQPGHPDTTNDGTKWYANVKHASTTPSEFIIKNVAITLSRVTPEGDLKVKLGGPAAYDYTDTLSIYPARVITPADQTKTVSAKFTIDSMSYVVNGETKAMDVAPFIKDNRTFVPVKYVAEALGVKESDIIWNPYAKSVTIFKGDRVIQMKIGSKTLLVNGATIEMDTAPEIKDARTVLPIAWVAKALNVDYVWNDAERSVEFNYVAR
ncbi:copper amine oxidase N-terminal domain-containing protein [Hydrogenibacillus schlegelii]|uniref:copper amine oxidase N-terminal domain-containing protein n=1 Tax=Hydrogenibacillus schlegelii TaxID=1484 RepID=UPI0009EF6A63|nr:copper amine oxidase N-terminal domain-containing protein [Hydrogenibacillus schlegelii]